jgi:hypothetical protein
MIRQMRCLLAWERKRPGRLAHVSRPQRSAALVMMEGRRRQSASRHMWLIEADRANQLCNCTQSDDDQT